MELITLQYDAVCKGCGKRLPAGSRVRYYRADLIYCETHEKEVKVPAAPTPQTNARNLDALIIEAIDTFQCVLADLKENIRKLR